MALAAKDARDRVEQLLLATHRLTELIGEETRCIQARRPLPAEADEKNRLVNAYRLELARIRDDRALIAGAPPDALARLRQATTALHEALAKHETALAAVKLVSEGLVQAMAEEVVRQRSEGASYGAHGVRTAASAPSPALIDRSA